MMTKPIVAKFGLGRGENGPQHVRGTIGALRTESFLSRLAALMAAQMAAQTAVRVAAQLKTQHVTDKEICRKRPFACSGSPGKRPLR